FRAYGDVNGDHIQDYCRFVGGPSPIFLSCQMGCPTGNYGSPYAFNSIGGIDRGYASMAHTLEDVDGDGRADFCRWVGDAPNIFNACDLALPTGFGFDPSQYGFRR